MTERIVNKEDVLYRSLMACWLKEGRPGYIQYGGKNYRVIESVSQDNEQSLIFLPVDERGVYGTSSL